MLPPWVKNFASTSSTGHRVTSCARAVFAGGGVVLAEHAAHAAAARNAVAHVQRRVGEVGLQLHHRHRRRRRQEMRVDEFRQVLGEARELGVDLHLHARGQEGEAFQQALDIRVGALEAFEAEAAGDLRVLDRELAAHLAQVLQLLAVVAQQARVGHVRARQIRTG
jgi:Tat protein secretion system quality control protein TatD with DNase activity